MHGSRDGGDDDRAGRAATLAVLTILGIAAANMRRKIGRPGRRVLRLFDVLRDDGSENRGELVDICPRNVSKRRACLQFEITVVKE